MSLRTRRLYPPPPLKIFYDSMITYFPAKISNLDMFLFQYIEQIPKTYGTSLHTSASVIYVIIGKHIRKYITRQDQSTRTSDMYMFFKTVFEKSFCTTQIICAAKSLFKKKCSKIETNNDGGWGRWAGGRKLTLQAPVNKFTPTWLHVLLFSTMHEYPPVKIVPTVSQSTHLL